MKKGLKIRKNNLDLIEKYSDIYAFFEVYIDQDFPLEELKEYPGKNITIHAAHYGNGFDSSDKSAWDVSRKIIKKSIQAADIVDSPWIIVHVGHNFSEESKANMLSFFDEVWDKRIIFENCPVIDCTEDGLKYLFSLPSEMEILIERYETSFVLDFSHAICTANILGLDVESFIFEFMKLDPVCFHVSGIEINADSDSHLHLYEVKNEMNYLKNIGVDKFVTLETPYEDLRDRAKQEKNIAFLRDKS